MRVAPSGLLRGLTQATRAAIAQFQAALTHGHSTGLAAADLTAFAIADLVAGGDPAGLPKRLREYALNQRRVYHNDWLGSLWQRFGAASPIESST
jgi:ADP-ribosylglycohydrolase